MTVAELIQQLSRLDPSLPVYASDSRNGETNRVGSAFEQVNKEGYDSGDILMEKSPKVAILSVG